MKAGAGADLGGGQHSSEGTAGRTGEVVTGLVKQSGIVSALFES